MPSAKKEQSKKQSNGKSDIEKYRMKRNQNNQVCFKSIFYFST